MNANRNTNGNANDGNTRTMGILGILAVLVISLGIPGSVEAESQVILTGTSFGGLVFDVNPATGKPERRVVFFDTEDGILWALECKREDRNLGQCVKFLTPTPEGRFRVRGILHGTAQGFVQVVSVEPETAKDQ